MPSRGTFSPARTIMVEPTSTLSGETFSSLPLTSKFANSGCKLVSSSMDFLELFTAKLSKIFPIEYSAITISASICSPIADAPITDSVINIFSFTTPLNKSLMAFKYVL